MPEHYSKVEAAILASGDKCQLISSDLLNSRFHFPHLNVILDLPMPHKLDNLIFDLTLIAILALLLEYDIPVEDILTLGAHHTHLAHQMMRDILHFWHLRLIDHFRVMILFHFHL